MSPRQNETDGLDGTVQLRTVAALLVTLVGLAVLGLGFAVYPPIIPIGLGFGGFAAGIGGVHLWRAVVRSDGERAQSRSGQTTSDDSNPDGDPVEILKSRYARGDVDDEEFERRIERLIELDSDGDSRPVRTDDVRVWER